VLAKAIQRTIFAASTDELKVALNGVLFDFKTTGATFVATDAHRLVRYRRQDVIVPEDISFILPQKALNLLQSLAAGSQDDALTIEYNQSNAFFQIGVARLVCRLIDARFPDYEAVIPKESPNRVVLNKRELLQSLRRLDIFSNKTTHLGRCSLAENAMNMVAEDNEYANRAKEGLSCVYDGAAMEIGFNISLMNDVIGAIETDEVVLELDTPSRAAVVVPASQEPNEDVLMLLMPVMLTSGY
jgi:DNA polymerase III subunit beta